MPCDKFHLATVLCIEILYILRKTIEGYLYLISFLTFNTIKPKLNIHAVLSSRYLQSKLMFNLNHASMVKTQYSSKWFNPYFVFHNDWLQNHYWLSVKSMMPNFVVVVNVLLPICCHIGYAISVHFVEEFVASLGAMTDKWV